MEVGVEINQYKVIEHIGRGGMADVWSARDNRLNRMVAIKTIAHGLSQDMNPVELFKREAQTIAQMEHPHILPIYDFGEYENRLYIVMRYVTGGSLENLLESNPLPPHEALRIGESIAQALDYAHQNNVIHLDLKPPNILMDSAGSPYVADFGLATKLDPEGHAQNPGSGTLLYMAPEQMVAEMIDQRADVYSFAIMMFHILTGKLPFDGATPTALRQLQYQDQLPDVTEINPKLPYELTDVLRRGTALDVENRPHSLMELIEDMQYVLSAGTQTMMVDGDSDYEPLTDPMSMITEPFVDSGDAGLLEAVDIYSRARHAWAGGQGRFLLGVTHFMLMSGYYRAADAYELPVDNAGLQMLLRGAIEYDHDLDYWWDQLNDADRRWVCLHTVRSGTSPARIRALYRLETLPDDVSAPVIPKLVAQALQVETDIDAKLAALKVLGTRARLMEARPEYEIETQYRGQLLTSMTRLGIQIRPPAVWRQTVYAPEIDLLIAETALDADQPEVADYAARVIGRIRSISAVQEITDAQSRRRPGALRALALVRDEAPSLPDVVGSEGRFYAWIANTTRRIMDRPFDSMLRFLLAMLGGWIAMGQWVFINFRSQAIFTPQKLGNTFAIGLMFGLFMGLLVLISDQFSERLRGFWPRWMRAIGFGVLGFGIGILAWASFTTFFLQQTPLWSLMRLGGLGLVLGFVLSNMLRLRGWQAFLLTVAVVYLPMYASHYNFCQQYYICLTDDGGMLPGFNFTPTAGFGLLLGTLVALALSRRLASTAELAPQTISPMNVLWSGLGGLAWTLIIWGVYAFLFVTQANAVSATLDPYDAVRWGWDVVTLIFFVSMVVTLVLTTFLQRVYRWAFVGVSGASFIAFYVTVGDVFSAVPVVEQGESAVSLLAYIDLTMVFTVGIPMAIAIALGGYAQQLFHELRERIGEPEVRRERTGWLTAMLLYSMTFSAIIAVMSLFNIHADLVWSLIWVAWGALTFVLALAVWQWKRWGARGLVLSGVLLLIGGFAVDAYHMAADINNAAFPALFMNADARLFWMVWALAVGVFAWGAARNLLWGGIGLLFMTIAWFFVLLFTSMPASAAVFVMSNLGLLAYTLRMDWEAFDNSKPKRMGQDEVPIEEAVTRVGHKPLAAPVDEPDDEIGEPEEMATEFDAAEQVRGALKTSAQLDNTDTTIGPQIDLSGLSSSKPGESSDPIFTIDTSVVAPQKSSEPAETELDPPSFRLDTSGLSSPKKTMRDMETELDASSYLESDADDEDKDDESSDL